MKLYYLYFILCLLPIKLGAYPVDVISCGQPVTFNESPKRAVSYDVNMTEMMFALGLQDRMVGYSGVSGYHHVSKAFTQAAGQLPQLAERSLTLESLLAVNADFVFAGWNYGLEMGGNITPDRLKPFGIKVYALTESCIHIMNKNPASFEGVYQDLLNLGKIFAVEDKAIQLVKQCQQILRQLKNNVKHVQNPVRVFLYDSASDAPFTAGRYAIPQAMIEAAGGVNIMQNMTTSWGRTQWESVVVGDPEVIIIVDYGDQTAQQKMDFLLQLPALTQVPAIKNKRFVVLPYQAVTPSVDVFAATVTLFEAFHPHVNNS